MSKFQLYDYFFYIIYKFIKLTTAKNLQGEVPASAHALLFIGLNINLLTFLILTRLIDFFPKNITVLGFFYIIINYVFCFLNKQVFLKNERYKEIEEFYDQKNNLKKIHFILISILYLAFSIVTMILAGINYSS